MVRLSNYATRPDARPYVKTGGFDNKLVRSFISAVGSLMRFVDLFRRQDAVRNGFLTAQE